MQKNTIVISALVGILVLSAVGMLAENGDAGTKALTSHDPIHIDGDLEFTAENGVTSGTGTEADPYIIENWDIDASNGDDPGICIEDTDAYFIIRNCVIYGGKDNYNDGIYFLGVDNGKIDNVSSYSNNFGILYCGSSSNEITNCEVYDNSEDGILLQDSSNNNKITNCNIYYNDDDGILMGLTWMGGPQTTTK